MKPSRPRVSSLFNVTTALCLSWAAKCKPAWRNPRPETFGKAWNFEKGYKPPPPVTKEAYEKELGGFVEKELPELFKKGDLIVKSIAAVAPRKAKEVVTDYQISPSLAAKQPSLRSINSASCV
ncbi:hypothetical protein GP486_003468, partial [Trichoglossum hirsutum]